jgi:hypothetical protein
MSFFDLKSRQGSSGTWDGMKPPPLTISTVWADMRWQLTLYRVDRLPLTTIVVFLVLRIVHLVQYNRGWTRGVHDV